MLRAEGRLVVGAESGEEGSCTPPLWGQSQARAPAAGLRSPQLSQEPELRPGLWLCQTFLHRHGALFLSCTHGQTCSVTCQLTSLSDSLPIFSLEGTSLVPPTESQAVSASEGIGNRGVRSGFRGTCEVYLSFPFYRRGNKCSAMS